MFNALKYTEDLERAGFTSEQAKASLKILIEVMNDSFATKSDLELSKTSLEGGVDQNALRSSPLLDIRR